jgi:ubiquinone biosynthesis protein
VAQPIFSRANRAVFHGDPHAGNLLYTEDGRLAILDWSLIGHLDEPERIAMGQVLLSAITLDAPRTAALLSGLDTQARINQSELRAVVDNWLRRIRYGQFPGLTWLVGMLDEAIHSSRLRMKPDMMIFRKSLLVLEGVVRDLGAEGAEIEKTLLGEFLLQFVKELPERWFSVLASREFPTRLSNLDLIATVFNLPLAASRCWRMWWHDLQLQPRLAMPVGCRLICSR